MLTNLERLQGKKTKVGQEEPSSLELLRRRRRFAVYLRVRERLGLPDVIAVPLQSILVIYLLGHQNAKLVVLNFQLNKEDERKHVSRGFQVKLLWADNFWLHKPHSQNSVIFSQC